jgi:phospholipid/cholesterol/gamma-HCH transport system ATP-binding protein
MIKIEDLYKSFDGNEVLKGIFLEVKKGEAVALVGSSGGGKSVLLKHVAGLMKPDRGHVVVDGNDMSTLKGQKLANLRTRIGFLFQGGALFDSLTIYENVAFPLKEKTRLSEEMVRERVFKELEHVGLSGSEHKFPSQISGGMIKRAALARALVTEPEIMLFDEPTTGLDPLIGLSILELIDASHVRLGFTAIIVTHEIPRIFEIVNRVAMLMDGRVYAAGTPEEILASKDEVVRNFIHGRAPATADESAGYAENSATGGFVQGAMEGRKE